ncbi:MAG: PQQ-binding-like beta-propeller repeat protein [Candidatus Bathyarchaeota archaeon]|nr:PQQ-binding-like beta-propeller repeat protein [Candidatus Bathyarchaeota archaeon]
MKKTTLLSTLAAVILLSATFSLQFNWKAEANFLPLPTPSPAITIKSDGSIDPSTVPIQRSGNTYTLTANLSGYTIVIERDYIVFDGAGYTIMGNGSSIGIFLRNTQGVTIRNIRVVNFDCGIEVFSEFFVSGTSSDNKFLDNIVEGNTVGIRLGNSYNNMLRNNSMRNNKRNLWLASSYINDIDASNTVNGKPVIYWVNQTGRTVPADAGFVALINCTNMKVQGLNLTNNGNSILLVNTTESEVVRNSVKECEKGIYLINCQRILISENAIENNEEGISLENSQNNTIALNNIAENRIGVYALSSSANNIFDNVIARNTEDGMDLCGERNSTILNNMVVDNNQTGISVFDSMGNSIVANRITGTAGNGVKLWYNANSNKILQNHVAANGVGILIADSGDNLLIGNNFTGNSEWGLRLEGTQNNNKIYLNNFVSNKSERLPVSIPGIWSLQETKPGGGNVWDNGTAGNYWSDYTKRYPNASESGNSGIGDTPYYINENNIDRYPLMRPVSAFEFNEETVNGDYDWPMFRANAARTGYAEADAPDSNQLFWRFKTGGAVTSSPTVAEGVVYFSSEEGYLYAVTIASGREVWRVHLGAGISSPAVASGKVLVTCKLGDVVAVDAKSGTQVWRQPLGEEAGFGSPLVVGSRVFVNGKRSVHVFNLEVGANLYNEEVNLRGSGSVAPLAYDGNLILALAATGETFGCNGFEAANGYGRFWVTIGPSSVDLLKSGAVVSDGKVFAVNVNPEGYSTVYAMNDFGMTAWNQQLDGVTEASPAVAYGRVYVPTDRHAYALNATDGAIMWSYPVEGKGSISSPAIADGKVFFGFDNGHIYALDAYTGALIWEYRTGGAVRSSPAISEGLLFVGSNDGYLYAIGRQPETGTVSIGLQYLIALGVSGVLAVAGVLFYFKRRNSKANGA